MMSHFSLFIHASRFTPPSRRSANLDRSRRRPIERRLPNRTCDGEDSLRAASSSLFAMPLTLLGSTVRL